MENENKMPRMRTIKEVAEETGLSQWFVRQLCLQKKVAHTKAGTKYLVNVDRFIEYLNNIND